MAWQSYAQRMKNEVENLLLAEIDGIMMDCPLKKLRQKNKTFPNPSFKADRLDPEKNKNKRKTHSG